MRIAVSLRQTLLDNVNIMVQPPGLQHPFQGGRGVKKYSWLPYALKTWVVSGDWAISLTQLQSIKTLTIPQREPAEDSHFSIYQNSGAKTKRNISLVNKRGHSVCFQQKNCFSLEYLLCNVVRSWGCHKRTHLVNSLFSQLKTIDVQIFFYP